MKDDTPDYSAFQSIDHINAWEALKNLTAELEERNKNGLSWILCNETRAYLEQEQTELLKQARDFSNKWEERRKECGRVPEYPGAFMTRQAPKFDDFTARAVMLIQAYGSYTQGEMLATCDLLSGALEKERETVKTLLCQIETLGAKAGESDALRGQVEAMKLTVQTLQNGIEDKQTIIDQLKTASQPKRPKLTQEEAADICGITVRTLQNWESGTTQAPHWYPGRDVTAVELKQRKKEGDLQKRVTQAARKGERNARQLKEEKDQPDE